MKLWVTDLRKEKQKSIDHRPLVWKWLWGWREQARPKVNEQGSWQELWKNKLCEALLYRKKAKDEDYTPLGLKEEEQSKGKHWWDGCYHHWWVSSSFCSCQSEEKNENKWKQKWQRCDRPEKRGDQSWSCWPTYCRLDYNLSSAGIKNISWKIFNDK